MNYIDIETTGRTNQKLLELLKEDDKEAFKELFHKHYKRVYYLCYKTLKDEALSYNLVHDVFLHLWEERHHHKIDALDIYLFAFTSTKIFDVLHSAKDQKFVTKPASLKNRFLLTLQKFKPA